MDNTDVKTSGMIDISEKPVLLRKATAGGIIYLNQQSINAIRNNTNPKGDVLENARLAAIHAVKKTPDLVFMAHPIRIQSTKVYFDIYDDRVSCVVKVVAYEKTGVEIEAMAGVMNALLAIFDLSKRFEKDEQGQYHTARIADIRVLEKFKEEM
ncbi:MAG: cyclic pyranopterin monophosphate synthase MoaC [Candidatus Heimdallarchaeota archaeon]|nr:cyclic pyranopterin monophosphate synthase MoaC [Candidatus Heimdallarchaeota archaeon]